MGYSWKFILAQRTAQAHQMWSWVRCRDGHAVLQSDASFTTFLGCVSDARLQGFDVADAFDIVADRRKTPRGEPHSGQLPPDDCTGSPA